MAEGWIGVDLDGTLAEFNRDTWFRLGFKYIGDPIPSMMEMVKGALAQGVKVKVFTARAVHGQKAINVIHEWLFRHGLPKLEVTNVKDEGMIALYDDRAVGVIFNTGKLERQDAEERGFKLGFEKGVENRRGQ